MKMHVVGRRPRQTGNYQGTDWSHTKIYVVHPDADIKGLNGEVCEVLKVPDGINLSGVEAGIDIDVQFNRYGRIQSIDVLSNI